MTVFIIQAEFGTGVLKEDDFCQFVSQFFVVSEMMVGVMKPHDSPENDVEGNWKNKKTCIHRDSVAGDRQCHTFRFLLGTNISRCRLVVPSWCRSAIISPKLHQQTYVQRYNIEPLTIPLLSGIN